jgi:hypothetical protein
VVCEQFALVIQGLADLVMRLLFGDAAVPMDRRRPVVRSNAYWP